MILTLRICVNNYFGTFGGYVPTARLGLEHLPVAELAKHFIHRLGLIFGGKEVFVYASVRLL